MSLKIKSKIHHKKIPRQGFSVQSLKQANPKNSRGRRTWEYKMAKGQQLSFYQRLKGEKFGNHFHKGEDPSKNPEIIIFTSGIVQIKFTYLSGKEKNVIIDATKAPQKLLLFPYVLHANEAKTDCTYVEYRQTWFDKKRPDTFSEKEFLKMQSQKNRPRNQ
ncbi:MAG: hypothetical protein PHG59_02975 [Patescibacteria group bacterium]|nr:hypothetical protein [Patescibacteria group bacterium]